MDSEKAVALTLLDLSAAFHTIDHSLLYDCLHDWFGLDDTVLLWIKSYLSNHKQKIKTDDSFCEVVILPFGVPQGSVLGPLLFTLYTSPLSQVISKFNVTHHLYADDTQIYLAVDSRNFDSGMEELTECLKSVQEWMDGVKGDRKRKFMKLKVIYPNNLFCALKHIYKALSGRGYTMQQIIGN